MVRKCRVGIIHCNNFNLKYHHIMKKISYILIILFFLLSLENILAQEMNHSPAAIEKMKLDQLWHKTDNAAGIFFDGTENYTSLNMSYNSINGNFHRPQQGKNENIWG